VPVFVITDVAANSLGTTYPYDVTVTRRETEGFGFVIISSVTKSGATLGEFIGTYRRPRAFIFLFLLCTVRVVEVEVGMSLLCRIFSCGSQGREQIIN
jgi:hypothetical protein